MLFRTSPIDQIISKHFHLPHMRVLSLLAHFQNLYLKIHRLYVITLPVGIFCEHWNHYPPFGLHQHQLLYQLQVLYMDASSYLNQIWSVAFVDFNIKINRNVADFCLFQEADVDEVGDLSLGLPEGFDVVVAQLGDAVADFAGVEGSVGKMTDFFFLFLD